MAKKKNPYEIEIFQLADKIYTFTFDINNSFFENREDSLVEKGELFVTVEIEKGSTLINMTMKIVGVVELICDRCLESFDFNIDVTEDIVFKFGLENKELDENLYEIAKDTLSLDMNSLIYEFVCLQIPYKKLHPKFQSSEDDEENEVMVYRSSTDNEIVDSVEEDDDEQINPDTIDPRWKSLLKLRKN